MSEDSGNTVKWGAVALALCGCLPSHVVIANDFPTQARVEFVLRCMDSHGGQKYESLYGCICTIDKIADQIAYDEYVEAEVFAQLWSTPGERGGVFRDPDRASLLVDRLKEVTETAEKSCFVGDRSGAADKEQERG